MPNIYNSQSFIILLLRHLFLSTKVFKKAKQLGLADTDFLPAGDFHLPIYKIAAELLFQINQSPAPVDLLAVLVRQKVDEEQIDSVQLEGLRGIFQQIYTEEPLAEDYFLEELPKFIKSRRGEKILSEADGDIERIHAEYNKVIFPLDTIFESDVPVEERFVNPFDRILKKTVCATISTGYPILNSFLGGGLGYREFGLIIGHSGMGKTAMGVSFARGAALAGHKAIYCSMEEEKEDIANRLYAAVFDIEYSTLHNGSGYMELDQKIASGDSQLAEKMELLKNNLILLDLKGMTPLKPSMLKHLVDEHAVKSGFNYDLLIVDQLQFLEPEETQAGEQEWLREGRVVRELDEISHQPVGDTQNKFFSMWVLHQAKGKAKSYFTTDEISGFKGIIHKPETVLGLGRENPTSDNFELFSMKNRHAKNFRLLLQGDLSRMSFIEKVETPGAAEAIAALRPRDGGACGARPGRVESLLSNNFAAPEMNQLLSPPAPS